MERETTKRPINYFIILVFLMYLLLGIGIYRDYGISSDEPTERVSTLVNIKYILNFFGYNDAVNLEGPELEEYEYRYYGTFLQMPTAVFELNNEDLRSIFWGRHLYTFGLCLIGYMAFFFLCRTLFRSNLIGILGTAMIALYPRFFAEQFYNIKDMVFVSTFMIAMFVTVKLVESKFKWAWVLCFAVVTAVSANVRIVGIIFLMLILGYLVIDYICGRVRPDDYEVQCKRPLLCGVVLILLFLIVFVVILPITWKNPIQGIWEVFAKFSNYDDWDSTIVFMGKVIRKEDLPWYYIPVWMMISVPVWYLILCVTTAGVSIYLCVKKIKNKEDILLDIISKYKYVVWCVLLMVGPWIGIVIMHSTIYNGWRHCYFLLPPLVLFILWGVNYLIKQGKKCVIVLGAVILIGGSSQIIWICNNHPYEMVYFNNIGKYFGEYFDRDYWHLASLDAFRYIVQHETDEKFSVKTSGNDYYMLMLDEEERDRIREEEEALYYIESYRGKIGNELIKEGYEEIYSILVNDFKISTVYKKKISNSSENK